MRACGWPGCQRASWGVSQQRENTAAISRAAAGSLLRCFEVALEHFWAFQAPKGTRSRTAHVYRLDAATYAS